MIMQWVIIGEDSCPVESEASFAETRGFMRAAGVAELPITAGNDEGKTWSTGMVVRVDDTGTRERFPDEDAECTALLEPLGFTAEAMGGNLVGYHRPAMAGPFCNERCGQLCPWCGLEVTVYAAECECLPIIGEPIVAWIGTERTWHANLATFAALRNGDEPGEST